MADVIKSLNSNVGAVGGQTPSVGNRSIDRSNGVGGPSFKDALGSLTKEMTEGISSSPAAPLKFSNHAVERMQRRGISFTQDQMRGLERAVDKAAAKGSKETLVLSDDAAMIVNVSNRTVKTVMDKEQLKENVFTNIDSTVMI